MTLNVVLKAKGDLATGSGGKAIACADCSRGFSSLPQLRGSRELAGTEYADGWGAHCYQQEPNAADNDKSFRSWTCAAGLSCQVVGKATRMGMCFVGGRQ
jgi:hypothetical protein